MIAQPALCAALTSSGRACRGRSIRGPYCLAHSPELASQRSEARRRGGHNSAKAVRLNKLPDGPLQLILDKLQWAFDEVCEGRMEPSTSRALCSLASTIVMLHEGADLESRLTRLEAAAATARAQPLQLWPKA